jgi:hemerythrin
MSKQARGKFGVELDILAEEHSHIRCRLAELDEVILQAQGSPRILEAARELVWLLLLHFTHEAELLEKISLPALAEQPRAVKKMMDEVVRIEAGLRVGEAHAALRLRGLCKGWIQEHMHMESLEFEIAAAPVAGNAGGMPAQVARPAL